MDEAIIDLLHDHGLKKTRIRSEILDLFMKESVALSAGDVLERMPGSDRVTIYRALGSFEEHGILHKASDDAMGVKYALCHSCSEKSHDDHHAHFVCDDCSQTYCLENVPAPDVDISEFSVSSVSYTLRGTCKKCKTTE